MGEPLAWGVAGFGWVARDYMVPAMVAAGHRLVAACDSDPRARHAAEALGATACDSFDALASDPAVEAVYVATPNHLHRAVTEALARAGKAVLCEKPMAATLTDALAMAEACRESGVLYGTAFDQRHHPAHRALREALRAGRLGQVTAVRIHYACWLGADWSAGGGLENWRIDRGKAGGGALMDLAPHGLDLIEFLLGEPLDRLAASTQTLVQDYAVDDGAMLVGATASGILACLHVAYNCPETLPRRRLEVLGTEGQFIALNTMGQEPGGDVLFTPADTGRPAPWPVPDIAEPPFLAQVRAFEHALRSGDHAAFSAERDLHTMRLIEQAYSCAGFGRR